MHERTGESSNRHPCSTTHMLVQNPNCRHSNRISKWEVLQPSEAIPALSLLHLVLLLLPFMRSNLPRRIQCIPRIVIFLLRLGQEVQNQEPHRRHHTHSVDHTIPHPRSLSIHLSLKSTIRPETPQCPPCRPILSPPSLNRRPFTMRHPLNPLRHQLL